MTDSMDGRVMRHLGHPAAHTPNMDRLAARRHLLQQRLLQLPQCAPSRASFWSGQYVHRVQAWNNPGGLPLDAPTFGTRLQDAGYGLHVFGKTDYRVGGHSLKARLTAWMRSATLNAPTTPAPGHRCRTRHAPEPTRVTEPSRRRLPIPKRPHSQRRPLPPIPQHQRPPSPLPRHPTLARHNRPRRRHPPALRVRPPSRHGLHERHQKHPRPVHR